VGDGGWTLSHDQARKALEETFGSRIRTTQVESVSEPADALRVMRGLAAQGNQLIFGTARRHGDAMHQMAAEFPNVKFESVAAIEPKADNVASYDSRSYQGAYLAGVVAGAMTQTNTLGIVAAQPTPGALLDIDSFTLGAQRTNPAITTRVVWVGEWFNPPKETEAAATLINGGADVLMPFTDSSAVLKTAEKMGKRGFGWNADMSAQAPKAHIASAIVDWTPYYRQRVEAVLDGRWKPGTHWWGVKEGAIDLVALAPDVPESARKALDEAKAGLKSGKLRIWRGPITDNQGATVLEKGRTADDAFLRDIGFYVQGVEGEVPAGQ
jgi:simple sugar transport system substrate-binding protein